MQRVIIVAEQASHHMGGESVLPLHYFREFRAAGVDAWLVVHERCRSELLEAIPSPDLDRLYFCQDTVVQRLLWRFGSKFPHRARMLLIEFPSALLTQYAQRKMLRKLVPALKAAVVHQPTPVSPMLPSAIWEVGAPVVIGPMNGGMQLPVRFMSLWQRIWTLVLALAKVLLGPTHLVIPGKRRAALLLAANKRTAATLSRINLGPCQILSENAVDMALWQGDGDSGGVAAKGEFRIAYVGRLVKLKAVDVLLEATALARAQSGHDIRLDIVGDGSERRDLECLAGKLGIGDVVAFQGHRSQECCRHVVGACDVFAFPSVQDCGGAAVLEAMSLARPVIAMAWGGPLEYVDDSCGVLIAPGRRGQVVRDWADAILRLLADSSLRHTMGTAGRRKIEQDYTWQGRASRMLDIYSSL